jgi:hypothetical protein
MQCHSDNQNTFAILLPYLFGLIPAILAWFAISWKIKFSTLHEKRALVIEEMYAKVVELREALKPIGGYDWQDANVQRAQVVSDSQTLDAARKKLDEYSNLRGIYFGESIFKLLLLINFNASHLSSIFRDARWTITGIEELSKEEVDKKIMEAREKANPIISEIKTLENSLKLEFQKLLGVDTYQRRFSSIRKWLNSSF